MDKPNETPIYVYTQHPQTIEVIKEACGNRVVVLSQNRSRDPIDDLLAQIPTNDLATLYAVLPIDRIAELRQRAPLLKIILLQLDGTIIERMTGRPYDPKSEYPESVVRAALKVIKINDINVRYFKSFREMVDEMLEKSRRIAIFNDATRIGCGIALNRLGIENVELVKTCVDSDCVEVNPLGVKSGYRISFASSNKLTPEQIAEALLTGNMARFYYVDVKAEIVPLCE